MYRNLITPVLLAGLVTPLWAAQFTPQEVYRGVDDSPFHDFGLGGTLLLEDFEDGQLNLPGVRQVADSGLGAGINFVGHGFAVAADAGDGVLGRALQASPSICAASYPRQCPASVAFEFDAEPFGILPTFVGFAWTDAFRAGDVDAYPRAVVEVMDAEGNISQKVIDDLPVLGSLEDSHSDDIFVGFMDDAGVSQIRFTVVIDGGAGGHLAMDHLQIGMASLPGDVNRDGAVEFNDFLTVMRNFGTPEPARWESGDFNFDRRVNFPDFTMLSRHWGREMGLAERFAVPEPTSASIVVWGVLLVLGVVRRANGQRVSRTGTLRLERERFPDAACGASGRVRD